MTVAEQGADAVVGRWLTIPRTLCFVLNGDDVLLMKRAAHKRVFPNRFNGVGGHIERDEDPLSSVKREIVEETGLQVANLRLRAIYNIDAGAATGIMLFVFTCYSRQRDLPSTTPEGTLHWIPIGAVLNYDLVEDLPHLLPRIFAMGADDPPYFVHVSYDHDDRIHMRFADDKKWENP